MSDFNITSLDLNYIGDSSTDENNVEHREEGIFTYGDGTKGLINALWFDSDRRNTVPVDIHSGEGIDVSDDIAALPDAVGFGNVYSLHQAMSLDKTGGLQALVEAFSKEKEPTERRELVDVILAKWTGQENIEPDSRRGQISGIHLGVLEAFWGQPSLQENPTGRDAQAVMGVYQGLTKSIYTQLMVDSHADSLFNMLSFTKVDGRWVGDFGEVSEYFTSRFRDGDSSAGAELIDFIDVVSGVTPYNSVMQDEFVLELINQASLLDLSSRLVMLKSLPVGYVVIGTDENDILTDSLGEVELYGLAGDDTINSGSGNHVIDGGTGNDVINSQDGGNKTLSGGAGDDTINSGSGNDVISGGTGNDTINSGGGDNIIDGGTGNDIITSGGGDDVIDGGTGNDVINSQAGGNKTLTGGAGDDTLALVGDSWNRVYVSESTKTLFNGGAGNDTLTGLRGADTYLFNVGDGQDVLSDEGGKDKIIFGEGISRASLAIRPEGDHTIIGILDSEGQPTGDQITLLNAFNSVGNRIETFEFSDGSHMTGEEVHAISFAASLIQYGSEDADTLNGSDENDTFYGLGGDDTINSGRGDDVIDGGAGNDTINSGYGNHVIDGGTGNDVIKSTAGGNKTLTGGAGDDTLALVGDSWNRVYVSESTKTLFNGGAGNDTLTGLRGADTYLFNVGDGQDVLSDEGGKDKIIFGEGISRASLAIRPEGDHTIIGILDSEGQPTGDQITLLNAFNSVGNRIETFEFSDGSHMTGEEVHAISFAASLIQYGSEDADTLNGSDENDTFYGLGGDDTINSGRGDDVIDGGAGNDTINSGYGNHVIDGGTGNDVINSQAGGNKTLTGGAGDDTLALVGDYWDMNKRSYVSKNTKTVFNGGAGNDTLTGLCGADTYLFNVGDGQDVLSDEGGKDKIIFGEGISRASLAIRPEGDHTIIVILDREGLPTGDQITLLNAMSRDIYRIEIFEFSDGSIMTGEEVHAISFAASLIQYGSEDADTLTGSDENDTFYGLGGDDTINSGRGDDVIDGGAGNDTINSGYGNHVIDGGTGNDVINSQAGGNKTLTGGAGDDTLALVSDYWDMNKRSYVSKNTKTVFNGGAGNDTLTGLRGADTYLFNVGDGQDVLSDEGGKDKIIFGEGISRASLAIRPEGDHTIIGILDSEGQPTGDQITLLNAFNNAGNRIETLEFSDGSRMTAKQVHAISFAASLIKYGSEDADTLTGSDENDTFYGLGGNDTINSGRGDDVIDGGAGNDTINSGYGNHVIDGGTGNDVINSQAGGNKTLTGGAGDDTLALVSDYWDMNKRSYVSKNTKTVFNGGAGNDTLTGLRGADTYLFNVGDGQDVLSDEGGKDKIIFGEGISRASLGIRPEGDHTIIGILDSEGQPTGDQITLLNAFNNAGNRIETLEFSDGSRMTAKQVHAISFAASLIKYGSEDADTLTGTDENDTFYGLGGNDTINSGRGDDVIDGGVGNDTLSGDAGSDTYQFGSGSGQDTVINHDSNASSIDIARFDDVSIEDLWFSRDENNLQINVIGTDDQVDISDWYSGTSYQLDQIQVGDSVLLNTQLEQLVSAMASFDVPVGAGSVVTQEAQGALKPIIVESWHTL
ncbi:hypothetical protein TUM4644_31800 [Shewanella colwelliana]|nr:hypothetical protein TUM4644_31800 [Shewanella colwelliana]